MKRLLFWSTQILSLSLGIQLNGNLLEICRPVGVRVKSLRLLVLVMLTRKFPKDPALYGIRIITVVELESGEEFVLTQKFLNHYHDHQRESKVSGNEMCVSCIIKHGRICGTVEWSLKDSTALNIVAAAGRPSSPAFGSVEWIDIKIWSHSRACLVVP